MVSENLDDPRKAVRANTSRTPPTWPRRSDELGRWYEWYMEQLEKKAVGQ